MEYQKIWNLLDNTQNQPFKFRTRNWVEINDDSQEHKTLIAKLSLLLKSGLFDCSDAYIFVKVTMTVPNTAAIGVTANNAN